MRKYRVFVVEDDEDDWQFLKQAFDEVGCASEMIHFPTSEELLSELEKIPKNRHPHLLILDHQTPGLSGSSVVARVRENDTFQSIAIIVYSSVITPVMRERLTPQGVDLCLEKGNSIQEVKNDVLKFCKVAENKDGL